MNEKKSNKVIIVCIDTNNPSANTLRYACHKAKLTGFQVRLLAITEASHKNLLFGSIAIARDQKQKIKKYLNQLTEVVFNETGILPEISLREGDIVKEIIQELKNINECVMIIFGKSKNSMSDNTVLPNIVKKMGNKIKIPVTIVPENLSDEYLKMIS
jgi:K+-sensing histidine kinase KdpD